MNDPKRLLTSELSERELCLLRAGASEEPPANGATRLALALGLAPSSIEVFSARDASASPAPIAGAAHTATTLSAKWIALIGAGAIALVGAALVLTARPAPQEASANRAPNAAPSAAEPSLPLPPPEEARAEPASQALAPSPGGEARSIAAELAQLERVRVRLGAGDGAGALALLAAYQRAHAAGAMREEAAFMRVEALALSGRRGEARRAAKSFERLYPKSVHSARVKAIAGSLDGR